MANVIYLFGKQFERQRYQLERFISGKWVAVAGAPTAAQAIQSAAGLASFRIRSNGRVLLSVGVNELQGVESR